MFPAMMGESSTFRSHGARKNLLAIARTINISSLPDGSDYLRRATGLSVFGCLDYRARRHGRLHSPRAARMAEKSPITPIASSVQTKKKCPLELASLLATPTPFPLMWM